MRVDNNQLITWLTMMYDVRAIPCMHPLIGQGVFSFPNIYVAILQLGNATLSESDLDQQRRRMSGHHGPERPKPVGCVLW